MKRLLKPLLVLVLILITQQIIFAQDVEKTVEIVVSGSAKTQDEAKQLALRSAIEQAFGVFISSKTEILNDNLVSDQITSIASGNIKSYQVLNESQLPDGSWGVTLKSIVSIDKLTSFVKAKGVEVEIKGGLFALNIKQQILNEKSEIEIVTNLIGSIHNILQQSFDFSLEVNDPKSIDGNSDQWEVPMLIKAKPNKNMDFCANYLINNLKALSLNKEEKDNYEKLNKPTYCITIYNLNKIDTFYLRTKNAYLSFNRLNNLWFYAHSFYINNGLKKLRDIGNVQESFQILTSSCNPRVPVLSGKIEFISSLENKFQVIYNFSDKLSLQELEKINKYEIHQDTLRNEYTNGGYIINSLTTNSKFIISPSPELVYITLNKYIKYDSIQNLSDSLIRSLNDKKYYGYNDWRLASIDEISSFIENYIGNNFDNEIFKKDDFIYLNKEEKKLEYKYCYQCTYKYNWGNSEIPILTSTKKDYKGYDDNGNYVLKKINIKCYFGGGVSIIKERESQEFVKKHLSSSGIINETSSNYPLYILFLVR
jgi:hypothetical protein